jgi:tetratricopeptide (TPR) repeat protein
MKINKHKFLVETIIFTIALGLRFIYLFQIRTAPDFDMPAVDALWHHLWAVDIANGDLIGKEAFFRAPLYPYFLGLIYSVFGVNYFTARLIQMIIGSLNCVLVYNLGGKIFNNKVGIIAATIVTFYGPLIYFDAEYLMPVLIIFFNCTALLLSFEAFKKNKTVLWFASGILFGLSVITRPDILFFVVILGLFLYLVKRSIKPALLFALGVALMILPITLRNLYVGGDFVPIASQGGINFYLGNNPKSDGKTAIAIEGKMPRMGFYEDNVKRSSIDLAERETGHKMEASEISNYWIKKSFDFMVSQPLVASSLFLKKIYYYLNSFEIESNKSIYTYKKFSPLLDKLVFSANGIGFPFGVIFPLAVLGIIIALTEKRNIYIYTGLAFILANLLTVTAFFVVSRFRVAIIPVLAIYAAHAVYRLVIEGGRISKKKYAAFIAIFLFAYSLSNSWFFGVSRINYARQYMLYATTYDKKGEMAKAEEYYKKSIAEDNDNPYAFDNLGILYYKQGKISAAFEHFTKAAKCSHQIAEAYNNLGALYAQTGQYLKALEEYKKALKIDPGQIEAKQSLDLLDSIIGK